MSSTILHLSSWARSVENQNIDLYHGPGRAKKRILFIGGVHGDEPEGVRLATDLLNWLQKNHNQQDLNTWWLIPCLNIDGYKKNQRTNANGVDLNRNFPSRDWQKSESPSRYYSGPAAASEPETCAAVDFITKNKPTLIVHFHSWEPCVVYTGASGKDDAELLARQTPYECREDIGYPTPGSLGQYGWINNNIPVICIEAQEKSSLETVWRIFEPGLIELLKS
jgi:protein MpaA